MSELETPTPPPHARAAKTGFNIYTVMVVAAFFAMTAAVGVMWYMNVKLTGQSNPFFVENRPADARS